LRGELKALAVVSLVWLDEGEGSPWVLFLFEPALINLALLEIFNGNINLANKGQVVDSCEVPGNLFNGFVEARVGKVKLNHQSLKSTSQETPKLRMTAHFFDKTGNTNVN
jgi:hypothetical protein